MSNNTRREHLKMLLGMAALGGTPLAALAAPDAKPQEPVPPEGIGYRIKHISYSDQGGRPDGVQVMVNRKHVYVGHMFSDGVTILDATDPRQLKPVGFFTAGATRARTICRSRTICCCSPTAPTSSRCSPTTACAAISRTTLVDSITNRKKFRSGLSHSRHFQARRDEGDRVSRDARPRHQPGLWWPGGRYAYVSPRISTASPTTFSASST